MNENLKQREQLSALVDGALQGEELSCAFDFARQPEGRETWHLYHLVGDVLRSPELASGTDSRDFLSRLRQGLAAEPAPVLAAPAELHQVVSPQTAPVPAANASEFRWKMVAGFASLAVVAAVGWNSWGYLQGNAPVAAPLAVAAPASAEVLAVADGVAPAVMIRDPRLDELLAAHKQFGSTSALQMPAGFLRNATFEAPAR